MQYHLFVRLDTVPQLSAMQHSFFLFLSSALCDLTCLASWGRAYCLGLGSFDNSATLPVSADGLSVSTTCQMWICIMQMIAEAQIYVNAFGTF